MATSGAYVHLPGFLEDLFANLSTLEVVNVGSTKFSEVRAAIFFCEEYAGTILEYISPCCCHGRLIVTLQIACRIAIVILR